MTFFSAVTALSDGYAAKDSSFAGGYVKRENVAKQSGDTFLSRYKLTFVEYSAGAQNPVVHAYQFTTQSDGTVECQVLSGSTAVTLDTMLFRLMLLSDSWTITKTSDLEVARRGGGGTW